MSITQLFLVAPVLAAECEYEGQKYQPGDTVGPLVCMPDGHWQLND